MTYTTEQRDLARRVIGVLATEAECDAYLKGFDGAGLLDQKLNGTPHTRLDPDRVAAFAAAHGRQPDAPSERRDCAARNPDGTVATESIGGLKRTPATNGIARSDAAMARVLEDLVITLVAAGTLTADALPVAAVATLDARIAARGRAEQRLSDFEPG